MPCLIVGGQWPFVSFQGVAYIEDMWLPWRAMIGPVCVHLGAEGLKPVCMLLWKAFLTLFLSRSHSAPSTNWAWNLNWVLIEIKNKIGSVIAHDT